MKAYLLIGIFGFLFLAGAVNPALSQSSIADHVVINEIDINPPGDDSKTVSEWVELYNPTDSDIDLSGWKIASTSVLKKTLTIPHGTVLQPERFLTYSYQSLWFTDVSEKVQLKDINDFVIDETPIITDLDNDFTSWQRIYDGVDTDSSSDWTFESSNAGSTNGKLTAEIEVEQTIVSLSLDKTSYLFGDTATISGEVSERIFIEQPFFEPEKIEIDITGPAGFQKEIVLFPDLFLKYKTELNLRQVLGFSEGIYNISVEYAGATDSTQFSLGDEIIIIEEEEEGQLLITTDKESYIPGETARINAFTTEVIPFEGLKFKVINPGGIQIFDGTLYPNPEGKFSTTIFITTVSPTYGTHQIIGEYLSQSGSGSFEVTEDVKEDKVISLRTDKTVYGPGDTVLISGRLNTLWIFSLDLEILQTGVVALDVGTTHINKVLDAVRLEGDSTFTYEYKIPNNLNSLGDYRVTVSKEVGSEVTFFTVVENPEEYVEEPTEVFSVKTDKTTYEVGDTIIISGKVQQIPISSQVSTPTIDIVIKSSEGNKIFTSTHKPSSGEPEIFLYSLTAVPDIIGNYEVQDTLYRAIYGKGEFIVTASYGDGIYTASTSFSVIDPLDIEDFANVWLDKEVYGLGEEVHLTGLIPHQSQGVGVEIILLKPDGDTDKFGTLVDEGRFSWSWTTPSSEKRPTIKSVEDRSIFASNFGIYRVTVGTDTGSTDLFFKVSPTPEEDSLVVEPITVTTEKPVYNAGEKLKVIGTALKRPQGTEGLVVQERAQIKVLRGDFPFEEIYEASVYLGAGGDFQSLFELPVTVFTDGTYKVTASYLKSKAENIFKVDNTLLIAGEDDLSLLITTDKPQYNPGDVVKITARPTKVVFPDYIRVGIPNEEQTQLTCGSFVCGIGVPINEVRPDPFGTFHYDHEIPDDPSSIGTFVITFETEFGTFTKKFDVVEKSIQEVEPPLPSLADRVIEKFNRIPDIFVPITVGEKVVDDSPLMPRTIQGSLFAPKRGEEANVNLKVSTESGTCVIGPDPECMIFESTRVPGAIYQTVEIEGKQYKIRYSGPDVRLEKFTILPESTDDVLPDATWNVDVIKEEQSSRFYYKVTYIKSE